MLNEAVTTDVARVLAELVDTALADSWDEDVPTMALLWEASDDPDDQPNGSARSTSPSSS